MGAFRYISADETAQRHRAKMAPSRQAPRAAERQSMQRNVEQVLSLGGVRYITYRDRTYRVPPVPYRLGQRVLDAEVKVLAHAKQVAMTGKAEPTAAFYNELHCLTKLLWSHIRPIGKVKRVLWRLHLLRNPLRSASEAEIKAITDFFLQGRMMSSVRSTSEMNPAS